MHHRLQVALDLKIKDVEAYGDIILIISQAIGEWTIKNPELASTTNTSCT